MPGSISHYLVCANTAKGFRNYFTSNLNGLSRVFILKGGPGNGKSTLMKKVGEYFANKGFKIEYIHCSSDFNSLDGVIIPELSAAIVDGTNPHVIEPDIPVLNGEYVDLLKAFDVKKLRPYKEELRERFEKMRNCYDQAYERFHQALKIHDEWEKIYILHMNYRAANELTQRVIKQLFSEVTNTGNHTVRHRFFGGSTCDGPKDYVKDLIKDLSVRYFIKGRPGSGKSTMLKKILAHAMELDLEVQVYHCGFDPDSLDMLLFPSMSMCIFDSTAPHIYEPEDGRDHVIDMYQEVIVANTDEIYKEQLDYIKRKYNIETQAGTRFLKEAKELHDLIEKRYIEAADFSFVESVTEQLIYKIEQE